MQWGSFPFVSNARSMQHTYLRNLVIWSSKTMLILHEPTFIMSAIRVQVNAGLAFSLSCSGLQYGQSVADFIIWIHAGMQDVDQRLTRDVDRLCTDLAELIPTMVSLSPALL